MKVFISSVHSGPNPSPGVGIARSLRSAYPECELVAVDYSNESSGIHHEIFDDVLLFRPWDELDLETHAEQVANLMESSETYWIPGMDLEVEFLAREVNADGILAPPRDSFDQTRKPDIEAADELPVSIPPAINAFASPEDVEQFCQRHGWNAWVKGPDYDAVAVSQWSDITDGRRELSATWETNDIVVQSHIEGSEVSVCFAAHDGQLVDAVFMEKRVQTDEGKTWAGHISQLSPDFRSSLESVVTDLSWTGGAELEFVRDKDDELHLIDWNPRFPAWIHGSTLTGHNLPGQLVVVASGNPAVPSYNGPNEFTRVVEERPINPNYPLPAPARTDGSGDGGGLKHPSAMPSLANERRDSTPIQNDPVELPDHIQHDLADVQTDDPDTPTRVGMPSSTNHSLKTALNAVDGIAPKETDFQIAYSVKTNPDRRLLQTIREAGMFAEVISRDELEWAIANGFGANEILINGPTGVDALLSADTDDSVAAVFADSVAALKRLVDVDELPAQTVGIRLNPPTEWSRFGIPIGDSATYSRVIDLIAELPDDVDVGLHLHIQSSRIGERRWFDLAETLVSWASSIEMRTGRPVTTLDFGGGWTCEGFRTDLPEQLPDVLNSANTQLESLSQVYIEPGKAIARPSTTVLAEVVETRTRPDGGKDVIVDAAKSDLPLSGERPHSVAVEINESWHQLGAGPDRVLGRICMESDIITDGVTIPESVERGDTVAFPRTGAYDTSMAYEFGNGGDA